MVEPNFAIGELVKLVFALGVTIGLFYALALFMKRMQVGTGKSGGLITVLAAMPLGAKEKVWVLEIAGEKLVVGTSPGRVNCLHVLKNGVADESEATTSSFPRRRESSDLESQDAETTMDSRLRGNEVSVFSDLLLKFRGGNKS